MVEDQEISYVGITFIVCTPMQALDLEHEFCGCLKTGTTFTVVSQGHRINDTLHVRIETKRGEFYIEQWYLGQLLYVHREN